MAIPAAMDLDPVASFWVWAVSAAAGAAAVSVEDAASAGTVRDSTTSRIRNSAGNFFLSSFILITSKMIRSVNDWDGHARPDVGSGRSDTSP